MTSAYFSIFLINLFLERGKRREKERGRNINVREKHPTIASRMPPTGDQTHNLGTCPDRELNPGHFAVWDDAQPTEAHQSGQVQLTFCQVTCWRECKKVSRSRTDDVVAQPSDKTRYFPANIRNKAIMSSLTSPTQNCPGSLRKVAEKPPSL